MRSGVRLMFLFQRAFLLVFLATTAVLARSSTGTAQASIRKDQTYRHAGGGQKK